MKKELLCHLSSRVPGSIDASTRISLKIRTATIKGVEYVEGQKLTKRFDLVIAYQHHVMTDGEVGAPV